MAESSMNGGHSLSSWVRANWGVIASGIAMTAFAWGVLTIQNSWRDDRIHQLEESVKVVEADNSTLKGKVEAQSWVIAQARDNIGELKADGRAMQAAFNDVRTTLVGISKDVAFITESIKRSEKREEREQP